LILDLSEKEYLKFAIYLIMSFDKDKERTLKKFEISLKKGEVDKPIIPLLKFINSLSDFYTTSSCAGRIILLHEFGKRKIDNKFILKEHDKINTELFLNKDFRDSKGRVWLKQEPFIIHIVARTLKDAENMLNLGLKSGLKHSGVFVFKSERFILELNGTQNLSVPIAEKGKLLIQKDYLKYLLSIADEKLGKNKETREKFEKSVRDKFNDL